jgi:hypothetical protein
MKMRVQQRNGKILTLEISPPFSILEGVQQDRIILSDGTQHFFTKEGYYDGWGKTASQRQNTQGKQES